VLSVGLSAAVLVQLTTDDYLTGPLVPIAVCSLITTAALFWRRTSPLLVAVVVAVTVTLQVTLFPTVHAPEVPFIAWVITVFSVSAYEPLARAVLGGAVVTVGVFLWELSQPGDGASNGVFLSFILFGFWIAGRGLRSRHLLTFALEQRTRELEAEREETARLAIAEERARIARELHDVIAHTLSVIVVQSGAERMTAPPGSARDALESIERTSRESLAEMGRLLGMLRSDDSAADLSPQPSLSRLDELLAGPRAAGVDVALWISGEPRTIQTSMDVSAYRIVQEAVTNSLKHGSPHRIDVHVAWGRDLLSITVADDGRLPSTTVRSGLGLVGLRERVALFDGSLTTARSDLGGFLLSATLPLST